MNNTPSNRTVHAEATFRQAGLDELMKDITRFSPAPHRSREIFVTVVNLALVAAIIGVLQPAAAVEAAIAGAFAVYTAIRWLLGTRKWENA